jgi:hypothetical protein
MEFPQYSATVLIAAAALVALLLLAVGVMIAYRQSRTRKLAERYGTEYDRTVEQLGGREKGEKDLIGRESRVDRYTIRPLSDAERGRFGQLWSRTLAGFVESPVGAVSEADQLLTEVMRVRGFPTADFDQRAADLSVEHPRLVQSYHAAHDLALKSRGERASTEDLRQTLVHYRVVFEELIAPPPQELAATH